MNTIEDRLRDAYQAAAQEIRPDSIGHVHDQALRRARAASPARSRTRPRNRNRVLIPLAAAAAVALIAVAASLVIPGGPGRGSAAGGAQPRFFLAQVGTNRTHPGVLSATTGRQVAPITLPRPGTFIALAASTGNDRIFVVGIEPTRGCSPTALYRLRLTARGRPSGLSPLAVPGIRGPLTALAASSDGRTIAYATGFCSGTQGGRGAIGVVHTATGQRAQWSWRPDPGQIVASVAITADGRTIEYAADHFQKIGPHSSTQLPVRTIRLLPANAPPGRAAQRSHVVVTMSRQAPGESFDSAAIAPDGRTLYFCTQRHPASTRGAVVLRGYDIATAATSVLHVFRWPELNCEIGSSGRSVLVGGFGHYQRLARYDAASGKSAPVPVPVPVGRIRLQHPLVATRP